MEISTLITLVVLLALGYWGVRKLSGFFDSKTEDEENSPDSSDNSRTIYDIADDVSTDYEKSARPEDLDDSAEFMEGVSLLASSQFSVEEVANYFGGDHAIISCMAAKALSQREDRASAIPSVLSSISSVATWPLSFGLGFLAVAVEPGAQITGPVVSHIHNDLYNRQARMALDSFMQQRIESGEEIAFSNELSSLDKDDINTLREHAGYLSDTSRDALLQALDNWSSTHIDISFLKSIGSVEQGTTKTHDEIIIEHENLLKTTSHIKDALLSEQSRSVLLVGETGVGKTSAVNLVTRELAAQDWTIFRAGHGELMAGQSYIGQLEERIQDLISRLGNRRKILWVIPDFHQLVFSGVHKYSPVSVLDAIAPAIEQGEIRIIGLTTIDGFKLATKKKTALTSLLSVQRMEPIAGDAVKTVALKALERSEGKRPGHKALIDEAWELAQQYISNISAPGNLFKLLALAQAKGVQEDSPLTVALLHETLAGLTGLPIGILDDREVLDIDGLQHSFNSRVLGQNEAVECLVERVAMIKAGLTDPTRPAGVFLFAGPTGTGKTELAKTLTEWLFGSPDRLIRYDMSEFQTPGDLEQMLGGEGHESQSIVTRLRERPFSVVLLDEFEKAHAKVWDLFLQVFDDGRLTDRQGRTADFRHTIIIMTSNLGAMIPSGSCLGFVGGEKGFDDAAVVQTIEKTFRKEFINRFDRIVVFQPLSRELMRSILEIELRKLQTRRGFRSRPWAVEWDESAIDFLLDKGFTPDMGARPLRRAIERYLLSPLAMTIVRHEAPAGDQFLFVTREGRELDVRFVDPDMPDDEQPAETADTEDASELTIKSIIRSPAGTQDEIIALTALQQSLDGRVAGKEWQVIKSGAYERMKAPDFWQEENRFKTLDIIERLGRIDGALKRATSLMDRLDGQLAKGQKRFRVDLVGSLAQTLFLLDKATSDIIEDRPSDAILMVSRSKQTSANDGLLNGFFPEIVAMYSAWAKNRRMKIDILEGSAAMDGSHPVFMALVSGFGAHSLLEGEHGLHVLDGQKTRSNRTAKIGVDVRVAAQPYDLASIDKSSVKAQCMSALNEHAPRQTEIVRHYKKQPSPMVRDTVNGWRTGNIDRVLSGDFDLF